MKLFNAMATVLCPGFGLALSACEDIKENGFLNSTTRKVLKYSHPSIFLADKALEDVQENGFQNSTIGQLTNLFLYGDGSQTQAQTQA